MCSFVNKDYYYYVLTSSLKNSDIVDMITRKTLLVIRSILLIKIYRCIILYYFIRFRFIKVLLNLELTIKKNTYIL